MSCCARATVLMPGTCGELVQGTMNGRHFLVSCPVDIFSTVTVELIRGPGIFTPPDVPKAAAALRAALGFFSCQDIGARLLITSGLPRSKGMASSTADVAGTIYATSKALGLEVTPAEVASLCLALEPTDGSVFPNIALFDHRKGSLFQDLGTPPPIDIVMLDFGGEIDTLAYNAVDRSAILRELEPQAAEALELVQSGLLQGDSAMIGRGATLSARAHQRVLYKPQLEAVTRASDVIDAVGVVVAHSGTIIGVLLDPERHDQAEVVAFLKQELTGIQETYCCHLISGGPRNVEQQPVAVKRAQAGLPGKKSMGERKWKSWSR